MGFRFRKRIRLAKGVYLNLGNKRSSLSVGKRGATMNISKRGPRYLLNSWHRPFVSDQGEGVSVVDIGASQLRPSRSLARDMLKQEQ
jgi:hypothetical protein